VPLEFGAAGALAGGLIPRLERLAGPPRPPRWSPRARVAELCLLVAAYLTTVVLAEAPALVALALAALLAARLGPRASNEMPGVPEAAKIEPAEDAGSPHTRAVWGRPRTRAGEDLQPRQRWRVFLLEPLRRVPGDWAYAVIAGIAGPAVEAALTGAGAFDYADPDFAGIPVWLPLLWANGGLFIRRLLAPVVLGGPETYRSRSSTSPPRAPT
jgi:hypothetical protein